MLKLTLAHVGARSRVELNGQDISRFIASLTVRAVAGEISSAVLEYTGAMVIESEGGVTLQQAEYLVRCDECAKVLRGDEQPVRVVNVTPLSADSKVYAAVTE